MGKSVPGTWIKVVRGCRVRLKKQRRAAIPITKCRARFMGMKMPEAVARAQCMGTQTWLIRISLCKHLKTQASIVMVTCGI